MSQNKKLGGLARNLRKKATDVENRLWSALRAKQFAGLKFRRQQIIGNYIVDFICLEKRLIIECDGSHPPPSPLPSREGEINLNDDDLLFEILMEKYK